MVCGHPELFSSVQPGLRGVPVRLIPLDVDPPRHKLFRGLDVVRDYSVPFSAGSAP